MKRPLDYFAFTMPGLESTAFTELHMRCEDARQIRFARGAAFFQTAATPAQLMEMRSTEDIFAQLAYIPKLSAGKPTPSKIKNTSARAPKSPLAENALRALYGAAKKIDVSAALLLWSQAHKMKPPRSWRVVAQMTGNHDFRRVDAGDTLRAALRDMFPPKIKEQDDEADLEIWLRLFYGEAIVGVRLSGAEMRHRLYKTEHIEGSLRPSIAAAMALLSDPRTEDIVIDPLCGAGTVIIERCLWGSYAAAYAGDRDAAILQTAKWNAAQAKAKIEWQVEDACNLHFADGMAHKIITNLPFGKKVGSLEENARSYPEFEREFRRILAPGGLLVTLTSDFNHWRDLLVAQNWVIKKTVVVVALGQPATISVAQKPAQ